MNVNKQIKWPFLKPNLYFESANLIIMFIFFFFNSRTNCQMWHVLTALQQSVAHVNAPTERMEYYVEPIGWYIQGNKTLSYSFSLIPNSSDIFFGREKLIRC